ncbi:MAG: ankyrin repeat domain-containing protein [Candidatus Dormiibacterota bacterium]
MAAEPDDVALLAFFRVIASGDASEISRGLESPQRRLAVQAIRVGASRSDAPAFFLDAIHHYAYAGDTALHVAAAAYQTETARLLISQGAPVRARNRRGAEPLHYAADGAPGGPRWNPSAQREVITFLVAAGADPNARDANGVAPLHRAVRTRCSAAVNALLDSGADPKSRNGHGSTPLHLAVQNTGRGGSGSSAATHEQRGIITLLLQHGAGATDTDAHGKSVDAACASAWIRDLLT